MAKNKIIKKELIVGVIGIFALLIIYLLINFFKGVNLFRNDNIYYAQFNDVSQLVNSSPIYLNGYKAGNVRNIDYDYNNVNKIIVEMSIDKRLRIPVGSTAKISTHMLGSAEIGIIFSDSDKFCQPGDTIKGFMDKGIAGEADEKIIPSFTKMLPKLDSILVATNRLLSNPAIVSTVENVEKLSAELNTTTKELNQLLKNDVPQITERMLQIEDDVLAMSSQLSEVDYGKMFDTLDSALVNVHRITVALDKEQGTMGMLLKDTTLYNNLNRTCDEAISLLENLRENPKRYVHFSIFGRKDK